MHSPCRRRPLSKSSWSQVRFDARRPYPLDGNSLSALGASEFLVTASMQGQAARGENGLDSDVATSPLNTLDIQSKIRSGSGTGRRDVRPPTC